LQDDDQEHVVAYASHRWSKTDSRRAPTERECMAILWAVEYFRSYIWGRKFTLVTDCSALTWLFESRELRPKLHRRAVCLMDHVMELKWRAGSKHQLPDGLSR
ncbi:unnamed protein product, partial [Choristocarpus tenellus]